MGQLLKSQAEDFNPQIHTEALSLSVHSEKYNEVHKNVINRFAKFSKFTSILYLTDRVNGGRKNKRITRADVSQALHDNSYRVKFEGMDIMPLISMGSVVIGAFHPTDDMTAVVGVTYASSQPVTEASLVKTDTLISYAVKHDPTNNIWGDKLNLNDKISLGHGLDAVEVITVGKRRSSTGDHYIYDGKFIVGGKFNAEAFADDEVLMESGNIVGEGSTTGYQRNRRSWSEIFYSHKSRYTLRFTGDALRQQKVHWLHPEIPNATSKTPGAYWEFEEEERADRIFAIMNELSLRHNVSTMKTVGHQWFENVGQNQLSNSHFSPASGITAPQQGDGFITSILGTFDLGYNPNEGLPISDLETTMNVLAENSPAGSTGNLFVCLGDKIGHLNFRKTMLSLIGLQVANGGSLSNTSSYATNVVMSMTNVPTSLGFEIVEYEYLGNKVMFIEDELLSHPGLHNRNGGLTGSGDLYFFNVTPMPDGTSTMELMAGARNRFFLKKYVNGLHSLHPSGEASIFASSGFDGAVCHYLTELMAVNYFPDCSAVIRATHKYTGSLSAANVGKIDYSKFPYQGPVGGQVN